jgi:hypothetical protein
MRTEETIRRDLPASRPFLWGSEKLSLCGRPLRDSAALDFQQKPAECSLENGSRLRQRQIGEVAVYHSPFLQPADQDAARIGVDRFVHLLEDRSERHQPGSGIRRGGRRDRARSRHSDSRNGRGLPLAGCPHRFVPLNVTSGSAAKLFALLRSKHV